MLTKADAGVAGLAVAVVVGGTYVGLSAETNVAAVLAFIAAIFVALLTAYWTQRRLSKELSAAKSRLAEQLGAETERLAQALAAEQERQAQQLAAEQGRLSLQLTHDRAQQEQMLRHNRELDDLSEARGVLDDAARALNEADRVHRDIYDDLGNPEKTEALKVAGRQLDETKQRIAIRFGNDHEVTTTVSACVELSLHVFGATTHWKLEDYDYARGRAKQGMADFEPAWEKFIAAATRHAGVALPDQASTSGPTARSA